MLFASKKSVNFSEPERQQPNLTVGMAAATVEKSYVNHAEALSAVYNFQDNNVGGVSSANKKLLIATSD